jgi:transcriptional regulator with XRE-family HTH domain
VNAPQNISGDSAPVLTRGVSSRVRDLRRQRQLTQLEVAKQSGLHRNSIRKIENGTTKEIEQEHADSLARVLGVSVEDLGVAVRPVAAPSIKMRQLNADQRRLLAELLSLPTDELHAILEDFRVLRADRRRGRLRGSR